MLLSLFLAQFGKAFLNNVLSTDTDKASLGDYIGTFVGKIATFTTEKFADNQIEKLSERIKKNGLPTSNEVQRSIRKAFLLAAIEAGKFINRNNLTENKHDNHKIRVIIDYLDSELSKFKDRNYIPEYDNTANKAYGYLTNKLKNLNTELTVNQLSDELGLSILNELEAVLYSKEIAGVPDIFLKVIINGWVENDNTFSFFSYISDYFNEFIKSDTNLQRALQKEWLTELLSDSYLVQNELTRIYEKIETEFEQVGNRSVEATGKLDEIVRLLKPQPKLKYKYDFTNSPQKTFFRLRYLNFFIGRETEMQQLFNFFDCSDGFAWWLLTGPGGIGKSRLALEFCYELSYLHTINAGFGITPNAILKFDWIDWEPLCSTLIIIDYASGYYNDIIEIVTVLSSREDEFHFPVRLLLLERRAEGVWWDELTNKIGHTISKNIYNQPLEISEFTNVNLWAIIEKKFTNDNKPLPNKEETLDALNRIDNKQRPLFAWFAAIALSDGENIRNWNVNRLLDYQLSREDNRIYQSLEEGKSERNQQLVSKHKFIVLNATFVNGLTYENVDFLCTLNYKELPTKKEFSSEIYSKIADFDSSLEIPFRPLEPDLLGEYFVLNIIESKILNPLDDDKALKFLISFSWNFGSLRMSLFTARIFDDFYENEAKESLIVFPDQYSTKEHEFFWSSVMPFVIIQHIIHKEIAKSILYVDKLFPIVKKLNISFLLLGMSSILYDLCTALNENQADQIRSYFLKYKEILQLSPVKESLVEYGKLIHDIINKFCFNNITEVDFYYKELKEFSKSYSDNEVVVITAKAFFNAFNCFSKVDFALALPYYYELKELAERSALPEVTNQLSKAAYNLSNDYSKINIDTGLPYYNDLKEIAQRIKSEEIIIRQAKALINICSCITQQKHEIPLTFYEELKELAKEHPVNEIILYQANVLANVCDELIKKQSPNSYKYYCELKDITLKYPIKETFIYQSKCASKLGSVMFNDVDSKLKYYYDIKEIAEKSNVEEVVYDQVGLASHIIILQNLSLSDFTKVVNLFNDELLPLANKWNNSKIWIYVESIIGYFIHSRNHFDEQSVEQLKSIFLDLYSRYKDDASWKFLLPGFTKLYQDILSNKV